MKNVYRHATRIFLILLTMAWSFQAIGQERTISGRVTSADDGEGLPGVNILLKGTSTGAVTDFDGNFRLTVPGADAVLVFSFIGYTSQEMTVGSQSVIDIVMQADVTALEEVVVTGYGTSTKREITSAVVSIKEEDFNQGNVNDAAQLLQGKVPGLTVVRAGGDPNGGYDIRLRGLATLGPNSQPLIIIDGVLSRSLDQVDPNDIASMDILKDAAAGAIYGTRGSNGVIIVTTKSGRPGTTNIEYNGYVAVEQIAKTHDIFSPEEFANFPGTTDLGSRTTWFDEISQTAVSNVHNISFSAGSRGTSYRMAINYRDLQGVVKRSTNRIFNGRVGITQKAIDDKLTVSANVYATTRNINFSFKEAFRYAFIYNPTAPVKDPDGTYNETGGFDTFNPVAIIEQNLNEGTENLLNFDIRANYDLTSDLNIDVSYAQQSRNTLRGEYYDKDALFRGSDRNGLASRTTDRNITELFETILKYNRDFNTMNFKALLGYTWQQFTNEGFFAEGGDFTTNAFTYNNLSAGLDFNNGLGTIRSFKDESTLVAFFARFNFNWDDKYFAMVSFRREGSSTFGANDKWGNFPAVSAGVDLARVTGLNVDQLKLRASYGQTGTLPPSPYLSLNRLNVTGGYFDAASGSFQNAYGPVSNPNPDLRWERKSEFDIGLDFSFFDFRLSGSLDYYTRTTKDLLLAFDVPVPPNQFPTTLLNVGEMQNNGIELGLRYLLVDNGNFMYEPGLTFSTYNTKLVSISSDLVTRADQEIANLGAPGLNGTFLIKVQEGEPIGQIWGPTVDPNNPVASDGTWNIDPGPDGIVGNADDNSVIGNGLPDAEIGWSNLIRVNNWDINIFFRGAFGHDLVNTFRAFYEVPSVIGTYNGLRDAQKLAGDGLTSPAEFSSFQVENASYFKLDNMTVGYNFDMSNSGVFNKIRLYASGQNLFVLTGYSGVDPEVRFSDPGNADNAGRDNVVGNPLAPGIDRRNTWYRTWTASFGLNFGFK